MNHTYITAMLNFIYGEISLNGNQLRDLVIILTTIIGVIAEAALLLIKIN